MTPQKMFELLGFNPFADIVGRWQRALAAETDLDRLKRDIENLNADRERLIARVYD